MKVNTGGYEAYPFLFGYTMRMIQEAIEELCKKNANNYSAERVEERLLL